MTKYSGLLIAALPLLGIAFFYTSNPTPPPIQLTEIEATPIKRSASSTQQDYTTQADQARSNQVEETLNKNMAETARAMTPKLQKMLIDGLMNSRFPRYRLLFDSWNLDSATATLILDIIRERESRSLAALQELNMVGVSGRKRFAEEHRTEKGYADIQMIGLLGEQRFKEFSKLEADMKIEMKAHTQKILNNLE